MSVKTEFEAHAKTGLPIEPHIEFEVGDLVTEHFLSDGTPGVIVHVTPKTVYVANVRWVGNFHENDAPGWNGYGDSGSIAIDPESVEEAVKAGKEGGATKYVLRVASKPSVMGTSFNDREKYGEAGFHRSGWRLPNSSAGYLSKGARYRRDPHV